jgi:hypothetical protein
MVLNMLTTNRLRKTDTHECEDSLQPYAPLHPKICNHCGRNFIIPEHNKIYNGETQTTPEMRYFPLMCGYCGEVHCKDHELPENHNCPNLLARKWGIYADDKISFSVAE